MVEGEGINIINRFGLCVKMQCTADSAMQCEVMPCHAM